MKYELKIDFKDTKLFLDYIKSCYNGGVLVDKTKKLIFDNTTTVFPLCKGLTNLCARLYNDEIIDGSLRFIINEENDLVSLTPCSIYYEIDNNKYSFSI
jgi:hypothetical protein